MRSKTTRKAGILKQNEVWDNDILVTGDILIMPNVTVTVRPGCRIRFSPGTAAASLKAVIKKETSLMARIYDDLYGKDKLDFTSSFIIVKGALHMAGAENKAIVVGNTGWGGAIVASSRGTLSVKHCTIEHASIALFCYKHAELNLSGSRLAHNKFGVIAYGKNTIRGNRVTQNVVGLECLLGDTEIEGNTIEKNEIGVLLARMGKRKGRSVVSHNKIFGNDIAINQYMNKHTHVSGNHLHDNRVGIYNNSIDHCEIDGNVIERAAFVGILCIKQVTALQISRNTIRHCIQGVRLEDTASVGITGNTIADSEIGIAANKASVTRIVNNTVSRAQHMCVLCGDFSQNYIAKNTFINATACIVASDHARTVIEGNYVSSPVDPVVCLGASTTTLVKNIIKNMDTNKNRNVDYKSKRTNLAVQIRDAASADIRRNKIFSSNLSIKATSHATVHIEDNIIAGMSNVEQMGIDAVDACEIRVLNNQFIKLCYGVHCTDQSTAVIKNNTISGTKGINSVAIHITGISQAEVKENTIRNVMSGIRYLQQARGIVHDNTIHCAMKNNTVGIDIVGMAELDIQNNTLIATHYGIKIAEQGKAGIHQNRIESSAREGSVGIGLAGAASGEIKNNTIAQGQFGVRCLEESTALVEETSITGLLKKTSIGIEVSGASEIKMRGVTLTQQNYGVKIMGQARAAITESRIDGAKKKGSTAIDMTGGTAAEIKKNTLCFNAHGVRCLEESTAVIEHNDIQGASQQESVGIEVAGSSETTIQDNRIHGVYVGIKYLDQSTCVIEKNTITGLAKPGSRGISALGTCELAIRENAISAMHYGIQCEEQISGSITRNTIGAAGQNGSVGIEIAGAAELKIEENAITVHHIGIRCIEQSKGVIRQNRIAGCQQAVGIEIANLSEVEIENNTITEVMHGIKYNDDARFALKDNTISSNKSIFNEQDTFELNTHGEAGPGAYEYAREAAADGGRYARLQKLVLNTQGRSLPKALYASFYRAAVYSAKLALARSPEVIALYLRRGLTYADWVPGSSDIDLCLEIKNTREDNEGEYLKNLWKKYAVFKKTFPFMGELQVCNGRELAAYARYGDIRALDAHVEWRLLHGSADTLARVPYETAQLALNAFTELFNLYATLCKVYFDRARFVNAPRLFSKAFIDILKYKLILKANAACAFESRAAILEQYRETAGPNAEDRALLDAVKEAWAGRAPLDEALWERAFLFIVALLGRVIARYAPELERHLPPARAEYTFNPAAQSVTYTKSDRHLVQWEYFCASIAKNTHGAVTGIILDSPGLLYIVVKDEAAAEEGFAQTLSVIARSIKSSIIANKTPCMVVTRRMLDLLLLTLHRESPYNYFKLLDAGTISFTSTLHEKRWQYGICRSDFARPSAAVLESLMRTALTQLTLSVRMVGRDTGIKDDLSACYARALGLHLAVKKKVIVEPFLDTVIDAYAAHFPESRQWLREFEQEVLNASAFLLKREDTETLVYKHYAFLRHLIDDMHRELFGEAHAS